MSEQIEARKMLKDLLDVDEGLTQWEVNFIENMSHWEGDFRPKQIANIEKIWNRVM